MVDKKTGVKPKASKTQKIGTSKKKIVKNIVDKTFASPIEIESEALVPNSELLATTEPEVQLTKAGKHSAKALKEAKELEAKEARKAAKTEPETAAKKPAPKPRSRLERAGKKYREVSKLIDKDKSYKLVDALELAVKTSPVKFDATIELHINLGVDPKVADQNVRDSVTLPAGTGRTLRVAVFAEDDEAAKAKSAGADFAGDAELLAQLDNE
ncbi:hypothetical protein HYS42_00605, partial [Candidatus Saccharibacteria bacterium]|nr:hypothetical protein [Candidatus Saccharibacteria bacterium]